MKIAKLTTLLLIAASLSGCDRKGSGDRIVSTNVAVVVWPTFPPATNSYRHIEHLQRLIWEANSLVSTNPAIFSQSQARGNLADNSPFRSLLGIPVGQPAYLTWWQSEAQRGIIVRSSRTEQRFGEIKVNLRTGRIDGVHDVEALYTISELERRLRQIVGTREEALRLFGGRSNSVQPSEREHATNAVLEAVFLPKDGEYDIQMSAPGGSNRGQGYLTIVTFSPSNSLGLVAQVFYPIRGSFLSAFGLSRPGYTFGGLRLFPAWTNLNNGGFLLDSDGYPYPKR